MANMKQVLEQLGWTNGLHIPVANAENIKLEAEVERLSLAKAKVSVKYEADATKYEELNKYLKHLRTEQEQNQNILLAQHAQLDTEKTLYATTKTEKEVLCTRIKELSKECQKTEARKQDHCKSLNKIFQKLEKIKISIEWDEETLEGFQNQLLKEQDDNDLIKKFSNDDKKKIRDLELKRQKLQVEEITSKELITRISTELNEMDLILTRSVKIYRQMHNERSVFVQHWKETVQYLHHRDKQILGVRKEILNTEDTNEAEIKTLEDTIKTHKELIANNKISELQIQKSFEKRTEINEKLHQVATLRKTYTVEKLGLKAEFRNTAGAVENVRTQIKDTREKCSRRKDELEEIKERIKDLRIGEKQLCEAIDKKNAYIKSLEEVKRSEENMTKTLEMKRYHTHNTEFLKRNELRKANELKKEYDFEIKIMLTSLLKAKKQKKANRQSLYYNTLLEYKVGSQFAKYERAVCRVECKMETEKVENFKLNQSIMEKKQTLANIQELFKLRLADLEKTCLKFTRAFATEKDILTEVKEIHRINTIDADNLQKRREQFEQRLHQLIVQGNIERVKLKHAERVLEKQDKLVYEAKRQQLELDAAMKERIAEININKKVFLVAKQALIDEHSELKSAISTGRSRANILKNRYDTLLKTFGKVEDGEIASPEYFWMKSLQEKMMLEEEGDKLDNQIKQTEQEIIAIENTLKVVTITNENYKKTLSLVDENDEILVQMKVVEKELYTQTETLLEYRNKLQAQQQKLRDIQTKIETSEAKLRQVMDNMADKERKYSIFQSDSQCRHIKIDRARKQIKKILSTSTIDENLERDFIAYKLKDYNRSALQALFEAKWKYPEARPNITRYMIERDLTMPACRCFVPKTSSVISTSSSSVCSIPPVVLNFD